MSIVRSLTPFRLTPECDDVFVCSLWRGGCQMANHLHWQLRAFLLVLPLAELKVLRDDVMIRYDCLILRVFGNCFKYSI